MFCSALNGSKAPNRRAVAGMSCINPTAPEARGLFFLLLCARLHHDASRRLSFSFRTHMEVVPEDLLEDMADDLPDGFLSGSGFGELCNESVTMIVPAACHLRVLAGILPGGLQSRDRASGITRSRLAKRADVPLIGNGLEFRFVLRAMLENGLPQNRINVNRSILAGIYLAFSNLEVPLIQVELTPGERFLSPNHASLRSRRA